MADVKVYLVLLEISGRGYTACLPAASQERADEMATALGGRVLGSNVQQVSAIPAEQLMQFCNAVAEEPIKWKWNAEEQLEAFLSLGWPVTAEEAGSMRSEAISRFLFPLLVTLAFRNFFFLLSDYYGENEALSAQSAKKNREY